MDSRHKRFVIFALAGMLFPAALASSQETVTITEPATVTLGNLFKEADLVADVRILSGDSEQYPTTIYKAEVLKAFKGTAAGTRIFFGPYVGYGIGGEYIAFLRRSEAEIKPKHQDGLGLGYGRVQPSYEVMYQGYGVMQARYVCVFEGTEIRERCGDGVRVNTHQVVLPKGIRTSPSDPTDGASGDDKWVRRAVLVSLLDSQARQQ